MRAPRNLRAFGVPVSRGMGLGGLGLVVPSDATGTYTTAPFVFPTLPGIASETVKIPVPTAVAPTTPAAPAAQPTVTVVAPKPQGVTGPMMLAAFAASVAFASIFIDIWRKK